MVCVKKNRNADTMLFIGGVGTPASRCSMAYIIDRRCVGRAPQERGEASDSRT
jgi:hypothetical protein